VNRFSVGADVNNRGSPGSLQQIGRFSSATKKRWSNFVLKVRTTAIAKDLDRVKSTRARFDPQACS
jgi:hypothetical protein